MSVYSRDEPLSREEYLRPGVVWLAIPTLWLLLAVRMPPDVLQGRSILGFVVVWVPYLLALFAFISLSMRRLLDLGVHRVLAWLALFPGAALPLYIVLAIAPSHIRSSTGR
jgi:uncharacterized membrane protein YhaH (DUF805 family)